MVKTGNPRQWAQRNWPPEDVILRDIRCGKSYVCEDKQQILAVFYFDFGEDIDPTYRKIEGPGWVWKGPYGVVHRIAARQGYGAGRYCIRWAMEQVDHLRIDTHTDNAVMQRLLESLGFEKRGIIYVAQDNDPRIAFEFGTNAIK